MPAPSRGLCVYDIDFPQFWEGRAFDADLMRQYPGAEVIPALAARLGEQSVDMITADEYLSKPPPGVTTVVFSNEYTRFTRELLFERRLRGALCVSGESPLVAWRFYANLPRTGVHYDHLAFFPGVRSMLDDPNGFHDFFWPNPDLAVQSPKRWNERSLLTLINSNKAILGWPRPVFEVSRPKVSLGRWYRALQANLAQ
ncbi:MAG: hypothetical protein M1565_02970, partial [Actinobacteria bacterium]|nr:hypothetical protein [Actinomycetota bacterium]